MSWGQRKEKNKRNELRKKVMWCIDIASVYLKWVSAMGCVSQISWHLATRIDEHFGKDKTSHIYQNLMSFKGCLDKCSRLFFCFRYHQHQASVKNKIIPIHHMAGTHFK